MSLFFQNATAIRSRAYATPSMQKGEADHSARLSITRQSQFRYLPPVCVMAVPLPPNLASSFSKLCINKRIFCIILTGNRVLLFICTIQTCWIVMNTLWFYHRGARQNSTLTTPCIDTDSFWYILQEMHRTVARNWEMGD